jgi:hypothetical protein
MDPADLQLDPDAASLYLRYLRVARYVRRFNRYLKDVLNIIRRRAHLLRTTTKRIRDTFPAPWDDLDDTRRRKVW